MANVPGVAVDAMEVFMVVEADGPVRVKVVCPSRTLTPAGTPAKARDAVPVRLFRE